jgi:hypothetical protein
MYYFTSFELFLPARLIDESTDESPNEKCMEIISREDSPIHKENNKASKLHERGNKILLVNS